MKKVRLRVKDSGGLQLMGFIKTEKFQKECRSLSVIVLGTIMYAVGMNAFIASSGLYSGGVTGISQLIIRYVFDTFGVTLNLGMLIWSINVPLLVIAYRALGKRFTYHTLFTITVMNIALNVIPIMSFSDDYLLNAVFGGVFTALGMGIILSYGGSTGGVDILSQYMSTKRTGAFGQYSFYVNALIITLAGSLDGWETALYTIILIFIVSQIIDRIHTPHKNYTVLIVTTQKEQVIDALQGRLQRGITVLNAEGAYTHTDKNLLMMVVSSYELYSALQLLQKVDPMAFTNVLQSDKIQGKFIRKITDKGQ